MYLVQQIIKTIFFLSSFSGKIKKKTSKTTEEEENIELVSKELNHLAAILHVYAGGLNFMK